MPFLNRLPISHMMLTLKYISQELISELQFRNGSSISHMMLIFKKKISQELTSKSHSGIDCSYLICIDFEIYIARSDLRTTIVGMD